MTIERTTAIRFCVKFYIFREESQSIQLCFWHLHRYEFILKYPQLILGIDPLEKVNNKLTIKVLKFANQTSDEIPILFLKPSKRLLYKETFKSTKSTTENMQHAVDVKS